MAGSRPAALLLILAASVLWGTTGTAASFLPTSVPGIATGAAAMGVGGVMLAAVFLRRALRALRAPGARGWILAGAVSVLLYPLAFYSGLQHAGVALATVAAIGSAPLFAALIERVLDSRALRLRWVLGALCSLLGLTLIMLGTHRPPAQGAQSESVLGLVLSLIAGMLYAFYTYTSKRAMRHHPSSTGVMSATFGLGGLLLLPVLAVSGAGLVQNAQTLAVGAYLAVVAVFLAYWLFGVGLKGVEASTATTVSLLEPVTAALLAVAVVGERITALGWLGVLLVLVTVASESTARRR